MLSTGALLPLHPNSFPVSWTHCLQVKVQSLLCGHGGTLWPPPPQPASPAWVPSTGPRPGLPPYRQQRMDTGDRSLAQLTLLFLEEQTEDQRNQVACPRSNSRAEIKTPDQGSLFGVLAKGSKVARLRSVRRSWGAALYSDPWEKTGSRSVKWPLVYPARSNFQRSLHVECHTVCPP